jgi:hypothetical protein
MSNLFESSELKFKLGDLTNELSGNNFTRNDVEEFFKELNLQLQDKNVNKNSDLAALKHYISPRNLDNLYKELALVDQHKAIGNAFHICPRNVPTNFFYSFVWGLISGCNNIVKLPTIDDESVTTLLEILVNLNESKKHKKIFENNVLIKYDRSSSITNRISLISDVRLIWGSDESVSSIKNIPAKLQTKDLIFRNRISAAIISTEEIFKLDQLKLNLFFERFSRDYFDYNQRACSSPSVIFWVNSQNKNYDRKSFWFNFSDFIEKNKNYTVEMSGLRISNLLKLIFKGFDVQSFNETKLKVGLLKNKEFDIGELDCSFGNFIEIEISSLDNFFQNLQYDFQTLTYYGFNSDQIKELTTKYRPKIDRIVPIGYALKMHYIWDGYNVLYELIKRTYID